MALTDQQLLNLLDLVLIQQKDMVTMTVSEMFFVNTVKTFLPAGAHAVSFQRPYPPGTIWGFQMKRATTADGWEVGVVISNVTNNGFTVTVDSDCTFEYTALTYLEVIAD